MSVKVSSNSPSQDYTHLLTYDMTPGFKSLLEQHGKMYRKAFLVGKV